MEVDYVKMTLGELSSKLLSYTQDIFQVPPCRADIWMASFLHVARGLVLFGTAMRKLLPLDMLTRC